MLAHTIPEVGLFHHSVGGTPVCELEVIIMKRFRELSGPAGTEFWLTCRTAVQSRSHLMAKTVRSAEKIGRTIAPARPLSVLTGR